ncbi:hypothetical protein FPQ18DRAFT_387083 [Pyronema domesticum]|nr:hypothetical protein FPQ18DRAFT_387083 [Pyronema domesticum]
MATVKPNTTYTNSGPNTFFNQITSISAISTRYIVYRLYVDQSVSRCFNLGPFTTLSEANLAVEQVFADEFRDRYKKEEFSNGLVSYKRLGKGNWAQDLRILLGFILIPIRSIWARRTVIFQSDTETIENENSARQTQTNSATDLDPASTSTPLQLQVYLCRLG